MKNSFIVAALASTVSATGFRDANPFTSPGNMNNKCTNKQSGGFDFTDFTDGLVGIFDGFQFNGFTCKNDGGRSNKRYEPRTIGGKVLGGTCHPEKEKSPSFGCGFSGSDVDRFSLGHIHVRPEFDCDLEFHYDMPDGSQCKHRSACSKSGTTVENNQCGGAKNVTIVYPTQSSKPKPTCSIDVHTISFSCGSTKTKPPKTKTYATKPPGTTYEASTTSASQPGETYSASQPPVDTYTAPGETTSASQPVETYTATQPGETTSVSQPGETYSASQPGETYSASQPPVDTYTAPGETTSASLPVESSTQPGDVATYSASQPQEGYSTSLPETDVPTSTYAVETTSSIPSGPTETLPCPNVVPACLNTFLFSVGCSDNSDTGCYCPDTIFVKNIFDCIYAHGETAEIVTEAIIFVQGLCAQYVPSNPAIATGATVTSYVTVTAAPTITAPVIYTTVSVVTTTIVPCTDSAGATIPGSSSTVVISTAMTVPQVGFTTGSDSSVGVVPVTTYPAVATNTDVSPITTLAPVGTGSFTPVPTNSGFVTVAGANRVGAGFGFAMGLMGLVAVL